MALKYHPDRNPLGNELMKAVNTAFDFLMTNIDKINQFQSSNENDRYNYSEELENILKTLSGMSGVIFEVIGNWVWISGETREHKNTLKELGCRWAAKKKQWFYRQKEQEEKEQKRILIGMLAQQVKLESCYNAIMGIVASSGIRGRVKEGYYGYNLKLYKLNTEQLIKIVGFVSTL